MTAFWEGGGADWVVPGALEVSMCEKKGKGREEKDGRKRGRRRGRGRRRRKGRRGSEGRREKLV